jgi:hypothetical protein
MDLKKVLIELESEEVCRALAIALDDDLDDALAFVKQVLAKRLEKALQHR